MKCEKCGNRFSQRNLFDYEIICDECGAAYGTEYLGYYPVGADERIDEGFEDEDWLKQYSGGVN